MSKRSRLESSKSSEVLGTIKENRSARSNVDRRVVEEMGNGIVRVERSSSSTRYKIMIISISSDAYNLYICRESAQSHMFEGFWRANEEEKMAEDDAAEGKPEQPKPENADSNDHDSHEDDTKTENRDADEDHAKTENRDDDEDHANTKYSEDESESKICDGDDQDGNEKPEEYVEHEETVDELPTSEIPEDDVPQEIFDSDDEEDQLNFQDLIEMGRGIPQGSSGFPLSPISTPPASASPPRPASPSGSDPEDLTLVFRARDQYPYLGKILTLFDSTPLKKCILV
jgi:hypothetical protein